MPRLDAASLHDRLAYDFRVLRGLASPALGPIRSYASVADIAAGRTLGAEDEEAGRATVFTAEYRFPILAGHLTRTDHAIACFDLLAGGSYPFSPPTVTITSRPLPWTPHVHPSAGVVCLGSAWPRGGGKMLAADLLVHVMRLLNFDEPPPQPGYDGYNPNAIRYWRDVLGYRPLNPDLAYPSLPEHITHPMRPEEGLFRAAASLQRAATRPRDATAVFAEIAVPENTTPSFLPARRASPHGDTHFRPITVSR